MGSSCSSSASATSANVPSSDSKFAEGVISDGLDTLADTYEDVSAEEVNMLRQKGYSKPKKKNADFVDSDDDSDEEIHIQIKEGELVLKRFWVRGRLGQGAFGRVLDVIDLKNQERQAMKVVKNVDKYLAAAFEEADILKRLHASNGLASKNPSPRASLCLRMQSYCKIRHKKNKHVCLFFPKLGRSLYSFLKSNRKLGYHVDDVRRFGYQLCCALAFCHANELVHTDLKPENILLVDSSFTLKDGVRKPIKSDICLIDFGGATFSDQHHSSIIATRQYRPPEVIMGLLWNTAADMWSVGCIISELLTGELLFPTHENIEHLAMMEFVNGTELPTCLTAFSDKEDESKMSEREKFISRKWSKRHDEMVEEICTEGKIKWPGGASQRSVDRVKRTMKIENVRSRFENISGDTELHDLLRRLLDCNPATRLSAEDALKHPWFTSVAGDYPA